MLANCDVKYCLTVVWNGEMRFKHDPGKKRTINAKKTESTL